MERARRIELGCVAASLAVAGGIASLADPLPPLANEIASEGWTRGIEFVLLVLVQWMLLSAVGLIHARIGVGLDGMTAERLVEAADQKQDAVEGLREELRQIHYALEQLARSMRETAAGSSKDHEERSQALEALRKAPPLAHEGQSTTQGDDRV